MSGISGNDTQRLDVVCQYGRYYGVWAYQKYLFPIDAEELERMDIGHKLIQLVRHGALYRPQTNDEWPLRVMDLGTGTGIWPINVADALEHKVEIMAVDLHKIQPALIPPEMTTVQFDIENPRWDPLMKDCDLVHIRMLFESVQDILWPQIYHNIFYHLRPGSGCLEHVEIDWVPGWVGDKIPERSALKEWSDLFRTALERLGRNARIHPAAIRKTIEDAGLTDFRGEVVRVHLAPWMPDKHEQEVARWFNLYLTRGLQAMSLKPMIEALGMSKDDILSLCERVYREICERQNRAYFHLHVWSARRPSH